MPDEFDAVADIERLTRERDGYARIAAEARLLKGELRATKARLEESEDALAAWEALPHVELAESPERLREPSGGSSDGRATMFLVLSDLHLDEIVRPEEVHDLNAYSRDIARARLAATIDKAIEYVARERWLGLDVDRVVIMWGGDLVCGEIHEELTGRGSAATSNYDTILHWQDPLAEAIDMLRDAVPVVHNLVVVGNHGRLDRKPRAKLGVVRNADYMLMSQVARQFNDNDNVTFDIPQTFDCRVDVGGEHGKYLLTHGDQFRGGSGIAGMASPIKRGQARKLQRATRVETPFDWIVMGHFHTLWWQWGLVVNGTMKGFDEYANRENFDFEPPAQWVWLHHDQHGPIAMLPLYSQDRSAEGW